MTRITGSPLLLVLLVSLLSFASAFRLPIGRRDIVEDISHRPSHYRPRVIKRNIFNANASTSGEESDVYNTQPVTETLTHVVTPSGSDSDIAPTSVVVESISAPDSSLQYPTAHSHGHTDKTAVTQEQVFTSNTDSAFTKRSSTSDSNSDTATNDATQPTSIEDIWSDIQSEFAGLLGGFSSDAPLFFTPSTALSVAPTTTGAVQSSAISQTSAAQTTAGVSSAVVQETSAPAISSAPVVSSGADVQASAATTSSGDAAAAPQPSVFSSGSASNDAPLPSFLSSAAGALSSALASDFPSPSPSDSGSGSGVVGGAASATTSGRVTAPLITSGSAVPLSSLFGTSAPGSLATPPPVLSGASSGIPISGSQSAVGPLPSGSSALVSSAPVFSSAAGLPVSSGLVASASISGSGLPVSTGVAGTASASAIGSAPLSSVLASGSAVSGSATTVSGGVVASTSAPLASSAATGSGVASASSVSAAGSAPPATTSAATITSSAAHESSTPAPQPSSSNWLPDAIITQNEPSSTPVSGSGSAVAPSSSGPQPSTIPTSLPKIIAPQGGIPPAPEDSTLIQIGFDYSLNYPFVVAHPLAVAQIFQYLPMGVGYGLGLDSSNVTMTSLRPYQSNSAHYVISVAYAYIPTDYVSTLDALIHNPTSRLYSDPNKSVASLMNLIDPTIPLIPGDGNAATNAGGGDDPSSSGGSTGGSSGDGSGSGSDGGSNNGGNDHSGPSDSGSLDQSSPTTSPTINTKNVGIAVGALAGSAAYVGAIFLVAKKLRQRRSSLVLDSDSGSESGGHGSRFFDDESIMSSSRASSRRGGIDSILPIGQQISQPVMSENSLGWT